MTPTAQAATLVEHLPKRTGAAHSLLADYQELFKVRVTSMVVLTAWAGFYLGSMRSGISSVQWGLPQALLGIALVSCGGQRDEPGNRAQT